MKLSGTRVSKILWNQTVVIGGVVGLGVAASVAAAQPEQSPVMLGLLLSSAGYSIGGVVGALFAPDFPAERAHFAAAFGFAAVATLAGLIRIATQS